ncbi:hypothetical protein [Actinomadura rupiterrae]|uniref:hypothetical protein n=1 Tax=Actinomadura rupiterrae TaxID=559627 RepID=UPI0020A25530|nr:hypothetical protein [Actinomadura rupiterrae]MCP2336579.1 hypothetical protein [Actinomadura rupiterrae]
MASAALVLCLSATACTKAAGASGGHLNPTGRLPTASPVAAPVFQPDVLAQYRRFHQVVEAGLATGDSSQVPLVATGSEAAFLKHEVAENEREGVIVRGHAVPHPHLASVRPEEAQIVDCVMAAGPYTFRRDTGKRVGGEPPAPRHYLIYAAMTHSDGTWKVSSVATPKDNRC